MKRRDKDRSVEGEVAGGAGQPAVAPPTGKRPRMESHRDLRTGAFTFVFRRGADDDGRGDDAEEDAEIRLLARTPTAPASSYSTTTTSTSTTTTTPSSALWELVSDDNEEEDDEEKRDRSSETSSTKNVELTALGAFEALPTEVMLQVLSFFDAKDLALRVALINRTFRELAADDALWRRFCVHSRTVEANMTVISLIFHGGKGDDGIRWKQVYRHLVRKCTCKHCARTFRPLFNNEQACSLHSGRWLTALGAHDEYWSCCRSPVRHDPGCERSWHEDICSWSGLF